MTPENQFRLTYAIKRSSP